MLGWVPKKYWFFPLFFPKIKSKQKKVLKLIQGYSSKLIFMYLTRVPDPCSRPVCLTRVPDPCTRPITYEGERGRDKEERWKLANTCCSYSLLSNLILFSQEIINKVAGWLAGLWNFLTSFLSHCISINILTYFWIEEESSRILG